MKKKIGLFGKVYISVFSVLLGLLIVAAIVLWSILGAYESTRPNHAAEDVFNKYFATLDFAGFMKAVSPDASLFESAENINNSAKEMYDPSKFQYFAVASDSEDIEQYAVVVDNQRIAYFSLKESDKKAKYGFKYFELVSGQMFAAPYGNAVIRIPEGYQLKLNGTKVGEGYVTATGIKSDSCEYVEEPNKGILYTEYKIGGLFAEPEITVEAPDSTAVNVKYDKMEEMYLASVKYDENLKAEHEDLVIDAVTAYTAYMSKDGSFDKIAKYLDKGTKIYEKVRRAEVEWVRDHYSFKITDKKASEFYRFSDDVFSCRVTMKETLKRHGYEDYVENIDVILYLHKKDGKFLIYDIVTNS